MQILKLMLAAALLQAQTFHKTSDGPYFSTVADLDGDGHPDVILPCRGELKLPTEKAPANDVLTVFYTAGSPDPHLRRDYRVGYGPYTAVSADLDGDGRKDVVVVNFQANDGRDLSILWGAGAGSGSARPSTRGSRARRSPTARTSRPLASRCIPRPG